jgi:hypothetical protein
MKRSSGFFLDNSTPTGVGTLSGRLGRAISTFVCLALTVLTMNAGTLEELRWKKRVIVIFAPAGSEGQLARQEQSLRTHEADLNERDVTQILLREPAENRKIADRFNLAEAGFTVLLIGKDGGEKLRSHDVVSPATLCGLIDSMPMRQEEMRK